MNELYRLPEELGLSWAYPGALFAQHVLDIVRNKLGTGFSNQA